MQVFIAIIFFLSIIIFNVSQELKTDPVNDQNINRLQSENKAQNIINYTNLAEKYIINNWSAFYEAEPTNFGSIENLHKLDLNSLQSLSLKNLKTKYNYSFYVFNYSLQTGNSSIDDPTRPPSIYLINTWDFSSDVRAIPDEVMGEVNQLLNENIALGTGLNQNQPIIIKQNNCTITQVYNPITDDDYANIQTVFSNICNQLNNNSIRLNNYLILENVIKR